MPLISKFLSIQLLFISEFVHFFPVSLELPLLMIQDPPTSPLGDCNSLLSGPSASILSPLNQDRAPLRRQDTLQRHKEDHIIP